MHLPRCLPMSPDAPASTTTFVVGRSSGPASRPDLAADLHRILRTGHCVANCPRVLVDLEVVAALVRLIAKKVDLLELGHVLQRERLVPPLRKHVERNLPSDGEGQIEVGKLSLHRGHHRRANVVLAVINLERVALLLRAVAADGAHVEHAGAELDERAALARQRDVGEVLQHPVDQPLQVVLAEVGSDRLLADLDAVLERHQPVLREAVVEHAEHILAELLLLLLQVRTAHETDRHLGAKVGEERQHLRRHLPGERVRREPRRCRWGLVVAAAAPAAVW
mmetsp:Transcript_93130/g.266026  ORF Transcript_93130/g.266026 Transcript_93130/m.266026 type:complete len:280 (+) Transcript_93130:318-1157(+)